MAVNQTVQAIQEDIEGHGQCDMPFSTVEYVLGVTCEDDDTFESAISALVDSKDWVTGYAIDWIHRRLILTGPFIESGDP